MINRSLSVYYPLIPNMGDILNVTIIEKLFGFKVKQRSHLTCDLNAIGSSLESYTLHGGFKYRLKLKFYGLIYPSVSIWGTGFISSNKGGDAPFYRRKMRFTAVRGQLSKKRVEAIIGKKLDIPTGDAGILSSYIITPPPLKKYKVGIISHWREQDDPDWKKLLNNYDNATFIDIRQHPTVVIPQIAECEYIISSSLHGLIVADSFNIPNIHVVMTDKPLGDGFKFDDYYSAYGIEHTCLDMKKDAFPTLEWIKDNYKITQDMVEKKKIEMIKAFPFKNENAPILSMI